MEPPLCDSNLNLKLFAISAQQDQMSDTLFESFIDFSPDTSEFSNTFHQHNHYMFKTGRLQTSKSHAYTPSPCASMRLSEEKNNYYCAYLEVLRSRQCFSTYALLCHPLVFISFCFDKIIRKRW